MSHWLIVGASSDIGKACARVYASHGHDLILTARDANDLADLCADLNIRHGVDVSSVALDILRVEQHAEFYRSLKHPISGVIVAVGYLGDQMLAQKDVQETLTVINSNMTGVIGLLNIIAEDFQQRTEGHIVAISSVAGDRGRQKNYLYGSAKAGLSAYLSGLRNRLHASGVGVLTVKPGFVDTKMTQHLDLPKGLTAQPSETAQAIHRAQQRGKDVLYHPGKWRLIMWIIRSLPEKLFKRLDL